MERIGRHHGSLPTMPRTRSMAAVIRTRRSASSLSRSSKVVPCGVSLDLSVASRKCPMAQGDEGICADMGGGGAWGSMKRWRAARSEERRVGKEGVSACNPRGEPDNSKKNSIEIVHKDNDFNY